MEQEQRDVLRRRGLHQAEKPNRKTLYRGVGRQLQAVNICIAADRALSTDASHPNVSRHLNLAARPR
jgi:hypothetical protein